MAAIGCWNTEPALDDLLLDPVMRLLMGQDHVRADEIRALIRSVQIRFSRGPERENHTQH